MPTWVPRHGVVAQGGSAFPSFVKASQSVLLHEGCSREVVFSKPARAGVPTQIKRGLVEMGALYAHILEDVVIRGADVIYDDAEPCFFEGVHPRYTHSLYGSLDAARTGQDGDRPERLVSDPVLLITHWTSATYGHFLLEMLPKIYWYFSLVEKFPELKILVSEYAGSSIIGIINKFVSASKIVTFNPRAERIRTSSLILVDGVTCRPELAFHHSVNLFVELCINLASRSSDACSITSGHIYLSRAKWRMERSDYRILMNERAIEDDVARCGFEIVHLEHLDWFSQVLLLAKSKIVVGEFCSALHNAIFAPIGSSVVALNYVNEVQDMIAALRRQRIDYVLPDDDLPRVWSGVRAQRDEFEISLERLRSILQSF
jgi:capsular polysaccharide biosynthesis protein